MGYIPYTDLYNIFGTGLGFQKKQTHYSERNRSQRGISFKQHYVTDSIFWSQQVDAPILPLCSYTLSHFLQSISFYTNKLLMA